jgi:hypothetical protein
VAPAIFGAGGLQEGAGAWRGWKHATPASHCENAALFAPFLTSLEIVGGGKTKPTIGRCHASIWRSEDEICAMLP